MMSTDELFHVLHGRGDDLFGITFPAPNDPVSRTLKREGRVELSSAAGFSWMRADLFVSDHPYYARTDAEGKFQLEHVPTGNCELVAWLPNWETGKPYYEADNSILSRPTYEPVFESVKAVTVESGKQTIVNVSLP
jgi:hypothetical protein